MQRQSNLFYGLLILILLVVPALSQAKGIIIGNDSVVRTVFNQYTVPQIREFADELAAQYDEVILHLGRSYPFDRGGFFTTQKSKTNLKTFCKNLYAKNTKVHLWFLDSYGSKGFLELYANYREIIDNLFFNFEKMQLDFDGIVIDMEWINRPLGNHNSKYLEILKYLKSVFPAKERYAFVSLVDDPSENSRRGFDEPEMLKYLHNLIPMLYLPDGGFKTDYGFVRPLLHDWRVGQLSTYYHSKNYVPALSVEKAYLVKRWGRVVYLPGLYYSDNQIKKHLVKKKRHRKYYYSVTRYRLDQPYVVASGAKHYRLCKRKSIFVLEPTENLLTGKYFIWEYLYTVYL